MWLNMECMHMCLLSRFSHVQLFETPWIVARQAPLSMGFSKQEYWSGLSCPPPGALLNPRIESASPVSSALQMDFLTTEPPGNPQETRYTSNKQPNLTTE